MNKDNLKELLDKYANHNCTVEERAYVEAYFNYISSNKAWDWVGQTDKDITGQLLKNNVDKQIFSVNKSKVIYTWSVAAAAVLICVSSFLYFRLGEKNKAADKLVLHKGVPPGTNAAQLTLADGTIIELDHASKGVISIQDKTTIKKLASGELVYQVQEQLNTPTSASNNTIRIPVGGQYEMVLPDGTHVWLNSSTSLIYPTRFTGSSREVTLTGEAYFEVAKNKQMPFKIMIGSTQIKVTGTHFNIKAYPDESKVTTTLLEGSVIVSKNGRQVALKPGEQAITALQNDNISHSEADTENAIAWTNGYFVFENNDISTIMNNIARWYDVDVVYEGSVKGKKIGGTFSKAKHINELLNYLETIGGIKFRKEGRRVTVMP